MQYIFKSKKLPSLTLICMIALIATILLLHLWRIDDIPQGLYVDESSIGLNAASIATSLRDEHGVLLPVYFEAFGEYKNPIYIYATSLLFMLFGVSDFLLRLTSFLFYALFLAGFIALVRELFPQNRLLLGYAILSAGLLPWLFSLSRVSFEVISQPAVIVWALYFFVRAYSRTVRDNSSISAFTSGALLGLSVYTYSTSRVLSFGLLALILLIYYEQSYWRRHAHLLGGFLLMLVPYIVFVIQQPGALTHRFNLLTYVFDPQLSLLDKIAIFIANYFSYFDLQFILLKGDLNLRHHTGFGGEVYFAVFALFFIGICALSAYFNRYNSDKRLIILAFSGLAITPIAAALTEPHHSLRSVMLSFYILLFSVIGIAALQHIRNNYLRYFSIVTLSLILIIESALYVHHYYNSFPGQSIAAFESYDFRDVLTRALAYKPDEIIVTSHANQPYAHLDYYRYQLNITIPTRVAEPVPAPHRCIIYFADQEPNTGGENLRIGLENHGNYSHLRCYELDDQ